MKKFKIGQDVWLINRDCTISKKTILAVIDGLDGLKYKVDSYTCDGKSGEDLFISEKSAKTRLNKFLKELNYKVGDIVCANIEEYYGKSKQICRIYKIVFCKTNPYELENYYKHYSNVKEKDIYVKVKDEYLEKYGNLEKLYKEYKDKEDELFKIIRKIDQEHESLEKDLKDKFKKNYSWWNRKVKKFKDTFEYSNKEYD